MNKFLKVTALSALSLALVACNANGPKQEEAKGPKTMKVGIAVYQFSDNYMTLFRNELKKQVEALSNDQVKYTVDVADGNNVSSNQISQIENYINNNYDFLFLNLVTPSAAAPIVEKLKEANIPAVFINREPEESIMKSWDRITYVGSNAQQSGEIQGQIIAELADKGDKNGDGTLNYFMLEGDPENIDSRLRTEFSVKQYLATSGLKVNELNKVRADWDTSKANTATEAALTQFDGKIEVIFANNDAMANGALAAMKNKGLKPGEDIYIVGVDGLAETKKYVDEGEINGTVIQDHIGQSKKAVEAMKDILDGKKVEFRYYVDYIKYVKK